MTKFLLTLLSLFLFLTLPAESHLHDTSSVFKTLKEKFDDGEEMSR